METPRQREKWTLKRTSEVSCGDTKAKTGTGKRTLEISCGDSKAKTDRVRKEDLRDQLWRLQGKDRDRKEDLRDQLWRLQGKDRCRQERGPQRSAVETPRQRGIGTGKRTSE